MQRSATLTGPGMARSPKAQRRTVRASTSSAAAASTWDMPSAAMASRNSSADNDTILAQRQALGGQHRPQGFERVVLRERVGQAPIGAEQRQALGPVHAARHEANRIGRKSGDGLLVHVVCIGPLALPVNGDFA